MKRNVRAAHKKPVPPGGGTQSRWWIDRFGGWPRRMDPRGIPLGWDGRAVRNAPCLWGERRAGTGRRAREGNGSDQRKLPFSLLAWLNGRSEARP